MRFSSCISALAIAAMPLGSVAASAQALAMAPDTTCPYQDPDSVQISWTSPCENGTWLLDTETGCRMWDWHPDLTDKAVWSGTCPRGQKQGHGVEQWFEHGQRIDRFEGTYVDDRREGFGRYDWNKTDYYEGNYVNDLPQGAGTAHIAGEIFAGEWRKGCFRKGEHVVAIGVPRSSCGAVLGEPRRQSVSF
jgi:hypothetical protein